jgi:hypothetical protein
MFTKFLKTGTVPSMFYGKVSKGFGTLKSYGRKSGFSSKSGTSDTSESSDTSDTDQEYQGGKYYAPPPQAPIKQKGLRKWKNKFLY